MHACRGYRAGVRTLVPGVADNFEGFPSESAFGRKDALGLLDYRTAAQGLGKLASESLPPGPLGNVDKAARRQVFWHLAGQQIIIGPVSLGEALVADGAQALVSTAQR